MMTFATFCFFPHIKIEVVTVVAVSHTVLQHGVPLLLLLLRHHAEVAMARVRVPKDEGELSNTPDEGMTAHFGLDAYRGREGIRFRDGTRAQNADKLKC